MGASALNNIMDRDLQPIFGGTTTAQADHADKELHPVHPAHPLASVGRGKGTSKRKPEVVRRVWKPATLALEKKRLEKKLLHKDEKLHELKNRCAHLLKVEKHCTELSKELNLKKTHVDDLTKSQTCMQHQVDNSERKHTEDLTLLVRALEKSKAELGSQHRLIEILVQDLQKMKSTLEFCKDELLVKDERKERSELQAKVAKLTQEGEVWKFEKTMLVSALRAAKKEFTYQHKKLNALQEKLSDQAKLTATANSGECEVGQRYCQRRVPGHERPHTHCAVCKRKEPQPQLTNARDNSRGVSAVALRQVQWHRDLQEKLRGTERELSHSQKKLRSAERERAELTADLAHARMLSYDMEYQMALLHDSLLESSARLEHVTAQLRESGHQRVSVQRSLECSLVNLHDASVDVVLENSAKELEFKSMKLLQRLMATRLRWGTTVATNYHALLIET